MNCSGRNLEFTQRSVSLYAVSIVLLVILFFLPLSSPAYMPSIQPKILYINSYHPGYTWSDDIQNGITKILHDSLNNNYDLRIEYMDAKHKAVLTKDFKKDFYTFLEQKYQDTHFDLIMVSDIDAYNFINEYHNSLFTNIPMLFCGVEFPDSSNQANSTGIYSSSDYKANIDLILKLRPQTKKIGLICDNSLTGKANREYMQNIIKEYASRVQIEFLVPESGCSKPQLINRVKSASPNEAIFFLNFYNTSDGQIMDYKDLLPELENVCKCPIFSHMLIYMNYGIIGGFLSDGQETGMQLAQIALKILKGTDINNIPIQLEKNKYVFDYKLLQKYNINLAELPYNSTIINQPPSFYEKIKHIIYTVAIVLCLSGIIIAILMILLKKQKLLRKSANENLEAFKMILNASPASIVLQSQKDMKFILVNSAFERMTDFTNEEVLGKTSIELGIARDGTSYYDKYKKVKTKDRVEDWECFRYNKAGEQLFVQIYSTIIDFNHEECVLSIVIDNTQKKLQAERTLVYQRRLELAMNATADAIWEWNPQTNRIYLSPRWFQMLGYSDKTDEMSLEFWESLVHPNDYFIFKSIFTSNQFIHSDSHIRIEFRMKKQNSSWAWILCRGQIVERDMDNIALLVVGTNIDITDRKQAEQTLKDSEMRLWNIVNASYDSISISLKDSGQYIDINRAFENLLGYSRAEAIGNTSIDLGVWKQEDRDIVLKDFVDNNYKLYNYETVIYTRHNKPLTGLLSISLLNYQGAECLISQFKDITDIKKVEIQKLEEEKRRNSLAEALSQIVQNSIFTDLNFHEKLKIATEISGKVLNAELTSIWHFHDNMSLISCMDLYQLSKNLHAPVDSEPAGLFSNYITNLNPGGYNAIEDVENDYRVNGFPENYFQNKSVKSLLDASIPVRNEVKGSLSFENVEQKRHWLPEEINFTLTVAAYIGYIFESEERKAAEAAVIESESKFRAIFEASPYDIMINSVKSGRFLDVNPAFLNTIKEESRSNVIGKAQINWGEIIPLDESIFENNYFKDDFNANNKKLKVITPKGTNKYVNYSSRLINYDNEPAVLAIISDLTDLYQTQEELKSKNEEMSRFIYTASHDLRSPLVTIKSFLGYLVEDVNSNDKAAQETDINYILNATDKMGNLLDELLQLSRIGRINNESTDFTLDEVVNFALEMVAGRIKTANIEIIKSYQNLSIYGDKKRIMELFQNLIDNAAKFMGTQKEPKIEIGTTDRNKRITVFIKDNGIGIDKRFQSKLFGLFEKLDKKTDGVGMGLAIAKRIVEVHNGTIDLESDGVDKGTCFYISLASMKLINQK